jgi:hypothetical protein
VRHLASSSASCRRSAGLELSRYDVLRSQVRIPSGLLPGSWELRPECRLALYGAKSFASHRMFCRFQVMSLRRILNMVLFPGCASTSVSSDVLDYSYAPPEDRHAVAPP